MQWLGSSQASRHAGLGRLRPAPDREAAQRVTGRTLKTACGWYTTASAVSTDTCDARTHAHLWASAPAASLQRRTCCARLVLQQVLAQALAQGPVLHIEEVRQALALLAEQAVEQRLQLLRCGALGHRQLGPCACARLSGPVPTLRGRAAPGRSPTVSPSSDWNCSTMLASGTAGASSLAFLAGCTSVALATLA